MTGRTKVLIVDDHPLFRQGLRQLVESDGRFELVGEAGDGLAALQLIQQKKPDVAVLDVNLPGLSGLEVARQLQNKRSRTRIVRMTMRVRDRLFCNWRATSKPDKPGRLTWSTATSGFFC